MNKKLLLLSVLLLTAVVGCKNKFNNSASQGSNSDSTEQVSTDEAAEGTSQAQIRQVDPALSGSDALEAIKKNYKGKVAFFDFWATWCPPCRAAMREVDQIKPELQKQGAVFVYITGETSPEEEWKNSLTEIHGDHYRLTDKQWQEINNDLHIPGIPVYFLLDRKGEMVFSNLTEGGYPGNDVVKKVITQALNQK